MIKSGVRRPTILVAEDDKDDQETLIIAFQRITDLYHLKMVENGKALVQFLSTLNDKELPCLIVLDYNMPELNGKDTLKMLNEFPRYKHIPKVIFTTSNFPKDIDEFLSIGARDYLIKPSRMDEIVGSARKMLDYCHEEK